VLNTPCSNFDPPELYPGWLGLQKELLGPATDLFIYFIPLWIQCFGHYSPDQGFLLVDVRIAI
jgi:hypothetical protein